MKAVEHPLFARYPLNGPGRDRNAAADPFTKAGRSVLRYMQDFRFVYLSPT